MSAFTALGIMFIVLLPVIGMCIGVVISNPINNGEK